MAEQTVMENCQLPDSEPREQMDAGHLMAAMGIKSTGQQCANTRCRKAKHQFRHNESPRMALRIHFLHGAVIDDDGIDSAYMIERQAMLNVGITEGDAHLLLGKEQEDPCIFSDAQRQGLFYSSMGR